MFIRMLMLLRGIDSYS